MSRESLTKLPGCITNQSFLWTTSYCRGVRNFGGWGLTWQCSLSQWSARGQCSIVWYLVPTSRKHADPLLYLVQTNPGLGASFSNQSELLGPHLFQLCFLKTLRTSSHQSLKQLYSFLGRSRCPWSQPDRRRRLHSTQHLFLLPAFVYVLLCSPKTLWPGMVLTTLSYVLNLI